MSTADENPTELSPDLLLRTTRAVRKRLDLERPVDIGLVRECLEVAIQAPNSCNSQRWHWIVVTDERQRAGIAHFYRTAYRARVAARNADEPAFAAPEDLPPGSRERRMAESGLFLAENLDRVPVLVIPCLRPRGGVLRDGSQARTWGSILPAAWNYMLAARLRGLGTSWTTLHLEHEKEVGELLGIPQGVFQAALIPTAHTMGTTFRPAARRPLETILHLDHW